MKDPLLESYLVEINSFLGKQTSFSEKAEIIVEIKSRILEAYSKQPELSLNEHIELFGDPKEVANRYLSDRGFTPIPTSEKKNIIKWLVIGFLGFVFLLFLFLTILAFKFSSLVQIDSEANKIKIDGILDIDRKNGKFFFGGEGAGSSFVADKVSQSLSVDGVTGIYFKFNNGDIKVRSSASYENFWYSCDYLGNSEESMQFQPMEGQPEVLAAESKVGVDCTFHVPSHLEVSIDGNNGNVEFKLDRHKNYDIQTKVGLGSLGEPPQSFSNGTLIKVNLEVGAIEYD